MMNKLLPRTQAFYGRTVAVLCVLMVGIHAAAQVPPPLKRFLEKPVLKGASVSFMAKEVKSGDIVYSYEPELQLSPASVMKSITTATALDILGETFRFETSVLYDGEIRDSVLTGNLYIYGTGDPTINSSEPETPKDSLFDVWASAIQQAGIRQITGSVIADESIFDTEGVSMKWMREDLGSDYGQGSYGLNIFDNLYTLYIDSDTAGTRPSLLYCEPSMPFLTFHNYLTAVPVPSDSCYITGFPFSNERYLYGVVSAGRCRHKIKGDIPDPSLYLAQYFNHYLQRRGIEVKGTPTCYRLLSEAGQWSASERKKLITTYSLPLSEMIRITNFVSHNLYADALLKTLGLQYAPSGQWERLSSFEKGVRTLKNHWNKKGLNTASLWMYDGSGLAITDKVTTRFLCDLYACMANQPNVSETYFQSLPQAGVDGTLRNMFKGSPLHGKARMKSGSMSRVRCYGGYITKDEKQYAVAILINNFSGKSNRMKALIEELFLSLF